MVALTLPAGPLHNKLGLADEQKFTKMTRKFNRDSFRQKKAVLKDMNT